MKQVIGQRINLSNEAMSQSFISDLLTMGVTNGMEGERLSDMDYYSLRSLLAAERIKRGEE